MPSLPGNVHYPGLDALRGLAVLSVVLFHYFPDALLLSWGWMGVDLFFVLSGFLITSVLFRADKTSNTFFRNFYARRLLRIVPLCFAILLLFFGVILVFDTENRFLFYKENWWYYFLFLENWLFVAKGLPQEYHLNHFWSLAVEEQFYLFFPLLVYFFSPRQVRRIILVLLPLLLCLRSVLWSLYPDQLPVYYCNTLTRIDSILFGCLLGCGIRVKAPMAWASAAALVLIGGILFFRSASITHPAMATVGYSLIALTTFFFLAHYTQRPTSLLWLRNNKALNFVGKISYGVYLLHLPVLLALRSLLAKWLAGSATPLLVGALSLALTLFLSTLSFYTLERYFLQRKRHFPVAETKQVPTAAWAPRQPED